MAEVSFLRAARPLALSEALGTRGCAWAEVRGQQPGLSRGWQPLLSPSLTTGLDSG